MYHDIEIDDFILTIIVGFFLIRVNQSPFFSDVILPVYFALLSPPQHFVRNINLPGKSGGPEFS